MYSKKPDLSNLNQMAKEVNSFQLPNIPENPHILLPPPEHSLIRNNFQVYSEELEHILNNPNYEIDERNKLEDFDVNANTIRGKSRQSIIGIKRHTERNTERLSITSNFKKRKTDQDYNNNDNSNYKNVGNNVNTNNKNNLAANQKKHTSNFRNLSSSKDLNSKNNNNLVANANRKRIDSDNNFNDDEDNKSEIQDINHEDYNNEEGDAEEYDQMETKMLENVYNLSFKSPTIKILAHLLYK